MESILQKILGQTTLEDITIPKKVYDILKEIQDKNKHHGFAICLGYEHKDSQNTYPMDIDIYKEENIQVQDANFLEEIIHSIHLDGAILIDKKGKVLNSGMFFRHDPSETLIKIGKFMKKEYLWKSYGFILPVGTRHLSAISASYYMPNTLIFVLSEEYNSIRIFHQGKIIHSPYIKEIT